MRKIWSDSDHKWPTPETRRIDWILNGEWLPSPDPRKPGKRMEGEPFLIRFHHESPRKKDVSGIR